MRPLARKFIVALLVAAVPTSSGFVGSSNRPVMRPTVRLATTPVEGHQTRVRNNQSIPRRGLVVVSNRGTFGRCSSTLGVVEAISTPNDEDGQKARGRGGVVGYLRSLDVPLLLYFALWYAGNYYYKITNKRALKAAGGSAGFPMAMSSLQLGIGCLYGIFLWLAPDARQRPAVTVQDIFHMLPLAFCYAGAHSSSAFAFAAGSVSFAEIVKAAEPAFAAVLSQFVYRRGVSVAKWWCLPIITGGVILASVTELDFAVTALVSACIANLFAAVRANENKKFIEAPEIRERLGSVGNQFALTSILGFILTIPFVIVKEGNRLGEFVQLVKTNPVVKMNLIASSLWYYGYNELSTMTLKKTGAVTQSVANTLKRVIVIVGSAMVLGEGLGPFKLLGTAICIGGVFLYSIVDKVFTTSK